MLARHVDRAAEYVPLLRDRIFVLYRQEQQSRPKEAALGPLIKLAKHAKRIGKTDEFRAKELCQALLEELKFCKPSPTVRGRMWHLVGILVCHFSELLEPRSRQESQEISLAELQALF
jgi:hypothetical protein